MIKFFFQFMLCILIVIIIGETFLEEENEQGCNKEYILYVKHMEIVNENLLDNGFGPNSIYTKDQFINKYCTN